MGGRQQQRPVFTGLCCFKYGVPYGVTVMR